jgi:hypothetical protein
MTDLQKLVANNRIEDAIDLLLHRFTGARQQEAISLKTRFTTLQRNTRLGTHSTAELNQEKNQIVASLLGLDRADSPDPQEPPPSAEPTPRPKVAQILFLAANPTEASRLQTDREHRMLKAEYERGADGKNPDAFLPPQFAVTIGELQRALDAEPAIIHFSGHGEADGLIITTEQNQPLLLGPSPLKRLFRRMQGKTELVILNACFSAQQAESISAMGIYVIGANHTVLDDACVEFSKAFYSALGRGKAYPAAYDEAITAIGTYHPLEEAKFEAWHQGQRLDW